MYIHICKFATNFLILWEIKWSITGIKYGVRRYDTRGHWSSVLDEILLQAHALMHNSELQWTCRLSSEHRVLDDDTVWTGRDIHHTEYTYIHT